MDSRRLFETGAGRIRWVALAVASLFGVLVLRLGNLQILQGGEFEHMARENSVSIRLMHPRRGRILDARGRVLAEDRPIWGVAVNFHEILDPGSIADSVARWCNGEPSSVARAIGSGWGDAFAPQVRRLRREALLRLLERLSRVTGRPRASLGKAVVEAENAVLKREARERARVAGLLMETRSYPRSEVRKAVREIEKALAEALRARVPEEEFLFATGFRWDLEMETRKARLGAYERLAETTGCQKSDLARRIAELDRGCARRVIRSMKRADHVLVEEGLEYDAVASLEMDWDLYPGVRVQVRARRCYPFGEDTAHVVGYVGYLGWSSRNGKPVNVYEEREAGGFFWEPLSDFLDREEYESMERRGEFYRDLFGRTGAEKAWDAELRGRRGARIVERDRRNRVQRDLHVHPPVHGGEIRLTLDAELQRRVREAFSWADAGLPPFTELRGAAVVLDVTTGAVLAMVSVPAFDANAMVPPVSSATAKRYFEDEGKPMLHRAIAGLYPPGSTFKVVTALAALEEALMDAGEKVECTGEFRYGNHTYRCWNRYGHGRLDLEEAIERSCNVYFYTVGSELGDALRRWAENWGFGQPTGFDLPGEKGGALPPGRGGDWVQQAIGQRMTATPLQVARLMAVVANGGRLVVPFIRAGGGHNAESQVPVVSPRALDRVRRGLVRVVEGENGTAKLDSLLDVKAAGKTGTAERGRGSDGVETNDAWFAGYAPHDDPKVAVAVVIEEVPHGVHGGDVAAPVAGQIFRAALEVLGVRAGE